MNDNVCLSGGAEGSDEQWGMCAGMAGHTVLHFSYLGHATNVPASELVILTDDQLRQADPFITRANRTLKRHIRFGAGWIDLLRRNWYQVKDTERLYAVGEFQGRGAQAQVKGGTAWAIQMFADRLGPRTGDLPIYLFDQKADCWMQVVAIDHGVLTWAVMAAPPPVPTGIWTGIGIRKILGNGKQAVRDLLGYQPQKSGAEAPLPVV